MRLRKFLPISTLAVIAASSIMASAATLPLTHTAIGFHKITPVIGLGNQEVGGDDTLSVAIDFAPYRQLAQIGSDFLVTPFSQLTAGSGTVFLFAMQVNEASISDAEADFSPAMRVHLATPLISLSGLASFDFRPLPDDSNTVYYATGDSAFRVYESEFARILARIVVTETDEFINPNDLGYFDPIGSSGDIDYFWLQYDYQPLPEPGTVALVGLGLAALGLIVRRTRERGERGLRP